MKTVIKDQIISDNKGSKRILTTFTLSILLIVSITGCSSENAATSSVVETPANAISSNSEVKNAQSTSSTILTRLFWQDREDGMIYSGDLAKMGATFDVKKSKVKDFPALPIEDNDLVQMVVAQGTMIVGVRDHEGGKHKSGWIEVKTGVEEEDHGDHSHWHYNDEATVAASTLDAQQGNPAHVYRYGDHVYIANDKNNGFTRIDPRNGSSRFFTGGGGHITMAAVNNRIAYSTWIDRDGDNKGRVDVINLREQKTEPAYSFRLPTGGIHGAGACGNRVYFAPANGIFWVNCDFDFAESADTVSINRLSLDETPEGKNYRTGAFTSFRDHMLCIANSKSGDPALCLIDATSPSPAVIRVACNDLDKGLRLSTVSASMVSGNMPFAFAFAEGDGLEEKLLIFELDPNKDRKFDDAKLACTIKVGPSNLQGHFGHHGIAFVGDGRTAVVTNPGDGTLSIISLLQKKVTQTIEVGGQPTKVVNHGKKASD